MAENGLKEKRGGRDLSLEENQRLIWRWEEALAEIAAGTFPGIERCPPKLHVAQSPVCER